jgi:HEAT repeat protein
LGIVNVAVALGELGDERAIEKLREAGPLYFGLHDVIPHAIRRIGGRAAEAALFELFTSERGTARREEIIRELRDLPAAEAIPTLLLGLTDAHPSVLMVSREVLWFMPHCVLHDGLRIALTNPSPVLRREAAAIAPYYADEIIVSELSRLAKDDSDLEVRTAAQSATDAIGETGTGRAPIMEIIREQVWRASN